MGMPVVYLGGILRAANGVYLGITYCFFMIPNVSLWIRGNPKGCHWVSVVFSIVPNVSLWIRGNPKVFSRYISINTYLGVYYLLLPFRYPSGTLQVAFSCLCEPRV